MQRIIHWIKTELNPRPVTSDEAHYENQESQSGFSLPVIYLPFDMNQRSHWADRGAILDFAAAAGDGDLLDFGPGDGWPSLLVAPFARSVMGVDASPRRIAVCGENARRLGIHNFRGVVYRAGEPLPFPDSSFDGAMAASSLEQSPNPQEILRELCRVLRPGGRLRIRYEAPSWYKGKEQEAYTWAADEQTTVCMAIDRHLEEEYAEHYVLLLNAPVSHVRALGYDPNLLRPLVKDAMSYTLRLPGARTWLAWLGEAGFTSARTTHGGDRFARQLFDQIEPGARPRDLTGLDSLLRPVVQVVVGLEAPVEADLEITAAK